MRSSVSAGYVSALLCCCQGLFRRLLLLFYASVASWVNSAIDERMFGE